MNQQEFDRIIAKPGTVTNPSQRLPKVIYDRYLGGECLDDLADDYAIPIEQVEWGIRLGYLLSQPLVRVDRGGSKYEGSEDKRGE